MYGDDDDDDEHMCSSTERKYKTVVSFYNALRLVYWIFSKKQFQVWENK